MFLRFFREVVGTFCLRQVLELGDMHSFGNCNLRDPSLQVCSPVFSLSCLHS